MNFIYGFATVLEKSFMLQVSAVNGTVVRSYYAVKGHAAEVS